MRRHDSASPYEGKTFDEWMPEVVGRVVEGFDPLRVILFGSRARGDAGPHSDVDLLVVMPDGIEDERRVTVEIRRVLKDMPVAKDIVVTTPEEIERRGDLVGRCRGPPCARGRSCMSEPERLAYLEVGPFSRYHMGQITPVASAAGRGAAGRRPQLFTILWWG